MSARIARANRMVELRARAADLAKTELAQAETALSDRRREVTELNAQYARAGESLGASGTATIAEWSAAESHLRSLSRAIARAEETVVQAEAVVTQRREALAAARQAHRALELWRDGLEAAARAVLERAERNRADEAAARTVRRSVP